MGKFYRGKYDLKMSATILVVIPVLMSVIREEDSQMRHAHFNPAPHVRKIPT